MQLAVLGCQVVPMVEAGVLEVPAAELVEVVESLEPEVPQRRLR